MTEDDDLKKSETNSVDPNATTTESYSIAGKIKISKLIVKFLKDFQIQFNFFSLSVRPTNGILTRHSFKDMGKLIKSPSRHKIDRMTQEASPTLSENVTLERTRQVCDGEDQEFPPEEVHSSPP